MRGAHKPVLDKPKKTFRLTIQGVTSRACVAPGQIPPNSSVGGMRSLHAAAAAVLAGQHDMVGAKGSTLGPPVTVHKVRAKAAPPDPDTCAAALLYDLKRRGFNPGHIHQIIDRLPKCRASTYARCKTLTPAAFGLDDEAED